ncbi:MAG: DUF72 domain-containing protein [Candidatus Anstonellales archaeon]
MIKIGCCGWNYIKGKGDKLINYANIFDVVEINSTFYNLPKPSTAEKWREKVDNINKDFEFTVKAYKGITHVNRFSGHSINEFNETLQIAKNLRANIILLQCPQSFMPTKDNIEKLKSFLNKIKNKGIKVALELRWHEWEQYFKEIFAYKWLLHATDPFRLDSYRKDICYFRLHGFGRGLMYNYKFSDAELKKLLNIAKRFKNGYIFFNNFYMYEDALRFIKLLKKSDN